MNALREGRGGAAGLTEPSADELATRLGQELAISLSTLRSAHRRATGPSGGVRPSSNRRRTPCGTPRTATSICWTPSPDGSARRDHDPEHAGADVRADDGADLFDDARLNAWYALAQVIGQRSRSRLVVEVLHGDVDLRVAGPLDGELLEAGDRPGGRTDLLQGLDRPVHQL